jgi:hypothetical protein
LIKYERCTWPEDYEIKDIMKVEKALFLSLSLSLSLSLYGNGYLSITTGGWWYNVMYGVMVKHSFEINRL